MEYPEGGWVVLACLEAEGEGVLPRRNELASEVIDDILKPGDDPSSRVPLDFHDLISSPDIVELHGLILNSPIGRIRTIHMNPVSLGLTLQVRYAR